MQISGGRWSPKVSERGKPPLWGKSPAGLFMFCTFAAGYRHCSSPCLVFSGGLTWAHGFFMLRTHDLLPPVWSLSCTPCFLNYSLIFPLGYLINILLFQSLSRVQPFATPWTTACQTSYPSPSPEVCPSSCSLPQWCRPAISSSDALFSCPWSFASSLVSFLYSMLLELFSYISTWISNKHLVVSITQSCPTLCDPMDYSMSDLLSLPISRSLPKFMFFASVMPSSHLILWRPLLLPLIFPSIRDFSNELSVCVRWPKYWGFSFSHSSEYSNKHLNIYKNRSFCSIFIENLFNPVSHKPTISYHISLPPFEAISTCNSPEILLAQLFEYPSF